MVQVVFLGTASCFPTPTRGVSCIALQWPSGDIWIVDCGEGSQIQIQRSRLKPGKITKIFITHLHGDHLFGLPGFLCTLGNGGQTENKKIDIYGPFGLKKFVETALEISQSPLPYACEIHEMIPNEEQFIVTEQFQKFQKEISQGIQKDNHISYCPNQKYWKLSEDKNASVLAGPIKHRIPSFGFVFQEPDQPGSLDADKLLSMGLKPGPQYAILKRGLPVTLDDGTVIEASEVCGETKKGKKLVILGDTCDTKDMVNMSTDCDLLIHEATMENALEEKAIEYGHSTPAMAAKFATIIKAKHLCLSHLSPRYHPIGETETSCKEGSAKIILDEATEEIKLLKNELCKVDVAQDFFELKI